MSVQPFAGVIEAVLVGLLAHEIGDVDLDAKPLERLALNVRLRLPAHAVAGVEEVPVGVVDDVLVAAADDVPFDGEAAKHPSPNHIGRIPHQLG